MSDGNGGDKKKISTVRKMPLWKTLAETILENGISHGRTYDAEFFEEQLSCNRNSLEFGIAVSKIREELQFHGFYLQGHVMREGKLVIVPADKHIHIVRGSERRQQKMRRREIALLGTTKLDLLSKRIRPIHEKLLMRIQIKQLLDHRAGRISRFIAKKAPKLLEIKQ